MIGTNGSIGIGVFGGQGTSSSSYGTARPPEIFTPAQDDTEIELSVVAKKVVVFHNGRLQAQTTVQVPDGNFTHADNSATVTFNFNLDADDVVLVIPYS